MSASRCLPDSSSMPVSVKRSMRSVSIDALPLFRDLEEVAVGTTHRRWSHGLYDGVKWRMSTFVANPAAVISAQEHFLAMRG